ncbi:class I SAM-dependent methyltransferase [Candidatus Omnitrophota bacterium]
MAQKNIDAADVYGKPEVFESMQKDSRSSAQEIVPIILQFIKPESVIDIGCGTGELLAIFKKHSIKRVMGVDGDWVDRKMLQIKQEEFIGHDLRTGFSHDTAFDLAVSLEVAQHIPVKGINIFVDSLARLAPVIVFAAPIPFQPPNPYVAGKYPLNEQWPEYWARLFKQRGFAAIDCLRSKMWNNERIASHYAQNIVLYAKEEYVNSNPLLKKAYENSVQPPLSLVHPMQYVMFRKAYENSLRFSSSSEPVTPYVMMTTDLGNLSFKELLTLFIRVFKVLPRVGVRAFIRRLMLLRRRQSG